MSAVKASFRAAKAAIAAQDYIAAAEQAKKTLDVDPKHYQAHILLGLALDKQNQDGASEDAYKAAINIKNDDVLAWQGLVKLHEKQQGKNLDRYHDAAVHLAEIYAQQDDKTKCQTVIDNYTSEAKKYGSRQQFKRSLEVLLPGSAVFDCLEGRIPRPAHTYSIMADLIEEEESERINSEIGQRRTRLGARIDQVTLEVKREVFKNSTLETVYANVISWTHDDQIRRQYEEKQLQHACDSLAVLPMTSKAGKRKEVVALAHGLVILKHPFILAWRIELEWSDVEDIGDLDRTALRDFIDLFPEDGLSKVIRGYVGSDISPFSDKEIEYVINAEEEDQSGAMSGEDRLIFMTEGLQDASRSMLAHRLMGHLYSHLDEYETAVSTLNAGLKRVAAESQVIGLHLAQTEDAMSSMLATALIQYQSPRHHGEARTIFEHILKRKPVNTSALIGIGMIFEEQEEYGEAIDFMQRALERSGDAKIKAETAWCKALNGDNDTALHELKTCVKEMKGPDAKTRTLRSQTLYRIGMCLWSLDTDRSARKDRKGAYAQFLASIQADVNFAPSYTSLGIYYADYAKDKKRAMKCFHKAFELSASEIGAAHRLAQSFAVSSEWDLVEVVAHRVIESGKVRPPPGSKKKVISWPFAALGVVQLNNQEYAKSIVSFQSALRNSPSDYHCWVGLGESYHYSGRYIAATKAFEHAQEFEETSHSESGWFTEYMLANVKRELGQYDEAVEGYQNVLASKANEFGVYIALLQTLVESAWRNIELGFFGRAADGASKAISVAREIVTLKPDAFSLWKAVGDACSVFCIVRRYESMLPTEIVLALLNEDSKTESFEILADIDNISGDALKHLSKVDAPDDLSLPCGLVAALLAHKRAVNASAHDTHARAVAWYNLGWTEHSAHTMMESTPGEMYRTSFLSAAVHCFKRAIELEAGNSEFWNSLGIVTCDLSPKISQHAFVRSLFLDDKNARLWANLGAFYLLHNDRDLAHEAFTRAQSTDPAYAQGWLGQGLLAAKSLDQAEARQLFAQAFEVADSSGTLIRSQYATAMFDHAVSTSTSASELLQPLLSLYHLRSLVPSDMSSQHLLSLLGERVGNFDEAESTLEMVCSRLEADYELSESSHTLMRFAQAKADLARVQLALREFDIAAENASTSLDLSNDEDESERRHKIRLSAHMTVGMAFFHLGSMIAAIDMFKSALAETDGNPEIVCLLSEVLWTKGGDSEREVAREQLLDCIEKYPNHIGAATLLGCIAILDDDEDTLEAVIPDLENLRTNDKIGAKERGKVVQLLTAMSSLRRGFEDRSSSDVAETKTTIMLSPSQPEGWGQLAGLSTETFAAESAILTATKAVPPHGALDSQDLCYAYAGSGRPDDAQRAIMVAPFCNGGWESLS